MVRGHVCKLHLTGREPEGGRAHEDAKYSLASRRKDVHCGENDVVDVIELSQC